MAVFDGRDRLALHIRVFHALGSFSALSRGYFTFKGESITVPPKAPPVDYPLRWCPNHVLSYGKCVVCVSIEGLQNVPKPPFKFYPSMEYDFPAKKIMETKQMEGTTTEQAANAMASRQQSTQQDLLTRKNSVAMRRAGQSTKKDKGKEGKEKKSTEEAVELKCWDSSYGVYIAGKCYENPAINELTCSNATTKWRGRPVGMLLDKSQDGWMIVQVLLNFNEARMIPAIDPPSHFDTARELSEFGS